MIHSNSFMYFRYLKCFYTWYWTPQKPCINGYYFCVVKMEELFAIAANFGKNVRNRGFSPMGVHPKNYHVHRRFHLYRPKYTEHRFGFCSRKQLSSIWGRWRVRLHRSAFDEYAILSACAYVYVYLQMRVSLSFFLSLFLSLSLSLSFSSVSTLTLIPQSQLRGLTRERSALRSRLLVFHQRVQQPELFPTSLASVVHIVRSVSSPSAFVLVAAS